MIKCIDCKFNIEAKKLGESFRLCHIPLPIGIIRHSRIYDEKKYGCVLGQPKTIENKE